MVVAVNVGPADFPDMRQTARQFEMGGYMSRGRERVARSMAFMDLKNPALYPRDYTTFSHNYIHLHEMNDFSYCQVP